MNTRVLRWPADAAQATEAELRALLEAEGFRVVRYTYAPGTRFPRHQHATDKCDAVVSGRFAMTIDGCEHVLGAGDRVYLAAGEMHDARVVGATEVVSLDGIRQPD